jgi:hypothetical protein
MTMRIGGLAIFQRTNSRGLINLASWHSPHSLTWRWILSANWRGGSLWRPHCFASRHDYGGKAPAHWCLAAGVGRLGAARISRDNNGIGWDVSLLGVSLQWSSQRPMWFRDLYNSDYEAHLRLRRVA